ncbi:MAG: ATP-dependent helicase [Deltaproteobacteria bacterium]|nr:ATP-dependent helicase [Deltaproteobacteria bacterium]
MTSSSLKASGIRDNHHRGTIGDFLKEKILQGSDLSFVSAYFTIYAYAALKEQLDQINHLRFLFGEPQFIQSLDPDKTEKKVFRIEDDALLLSNRLEQKRVAKECSDWLKSKVDVRSIIKPGFLHGKMYHMDNNGVQEAIIGSSNFTVRGLGLGATGNNIELNLEVDSTRDRKDLKKWFDEVWNDNTLVEDVKTDVLDYLAQLYENHSPEFIYFKTLFHIFEDYLSEAERGGLLDEKTGFFESDVWDMLYEFQKDGVKGAINKILKHHGCIIADSVGLGKTFEALAVIKYFELLNGRVLVLCPKKLEHNWKVYRDNDTRNPLIRDRFAFTVLAHTDLGRDACETHNWGNYDLVVIDESHNFRNNARGKDQEDGTRKITRYEFLMDKVLQEGVDTKVLLLSATPVNNSLKDLRNQFLLITQDEDAAFHESLGIYSISQAMKNAQTHFTQWADPKKNPERKVSRLLDALDSTFFKLLDELTIARSRRHIISYYGTRDMGEFPKRLKPIALHPATDIKGYFPSYDDLHAAISEYKLSIFNPSAYLKDAYVNLYIKDGMQQVLFSDQKSRESYLIGMMRTNYLKRLESSVHSFEVSIDRTIRKIEDLLEKIDYFEGNFDEYTNPDLFKEQGEEEEAELLERLMVGKKLPIRLEHLKRKEWKKDLKKDRTQLIAIHEKAAAVTADRDAKLQELKRLIQDKINHPLNDDNRKLLVFTAFSDTAQYLYANLKDWVFEEMGLHIALVTGTGDNRTTFKQAGYARQTDFISILTNFSPRSKLREKMPNMPQEGEIDILIATDCISEGQNLQDCDYLINYDIHWNPVRIIQRFGRIDRLGSTNSQIQLVNFWPTDDLNKYINLKDRVEARMAMVDLAASGADNLLDPDQLEALVAEELTYREKQLIRLRDEVIDLEEMDDNVSLSEFTLDDFRVELMNFLAGNRKQLEEAPLGLYAVTPTLDGMKSATLFDKNWHEIVKPGVIFCLRHKNPPQEKRSSNVNPLGRYYLLYIRDDGTVRFTFTQAKNVLSMFQKLSVGRAAPYQALCDLFDRGTENGAKMEKYSDLLVKAINAIVRTFQKRTAAGLQSGRDFVIPDKQEQATDAADFELITWLVIKSGETDG